MLTSTALVTLTGRVAVSLIVEYPRVPSAERRDLRLIARRSKLLITAHKTEQLDVVPKAKLLLVITGETNNEVGIQSQFPQFSIRPGDERRKAVCAMSTEQLAWKLSWCEQRNDHNGKWRFLHGERMVFDVARF